MGASLFLWMLFAGEKRKTDKKTEISREGIFHLHGVYIKRKTIT